MLKTIRKDVIGVMKVLVLLPLWLLVLPMHRDRVFRHYSWTLDGFRRNPFTRKAYICCFVCWLAFG